MTDASRYRRYMLGLLLAILASSILDRNVLSLVLQDVKTDLDLSDSQLGLLTGFAFSIFYALVGVPLAQWADRGNRVKIIAITTMLWSLMAALTGLVGSFIQLLGVRIGAAVGEAGCMPPAHSLLADYYSRRERPKAVSIYMLGAILSVIVAFLAGGWLAALYGWRITFVVLGIPGVLLGLLALTTLREPRLMGAHGRNHECKVVRTHSPGTEPAPVATGTLPVSLVFRHLWRQKSLRHLVAAFTIASFVGVGTTSWLPSFFVRSHEVPLQELGIWMAGIWATFGVLGTYTGGTLASRYAANREKLQFQIIGLTTAAISLLSVGTYLVPSKFLAMVLYGVSIFGAAATNGPLFAAIQCLAEPRMIARIVAIIYLLSNLIGMGLGPLMVGMMSDSLAEALGDESLRYALIILSPVYLWMTAHLLLASKTVVSDIETRGCERSTVKAEIL